MAQAVEAGTCSFPFTWENPADAELYWVTDLQHHAYPQVPLAGSLGQAFPRGMDKAFDFGGAAPPPSRRMTVNGYEYTLVRPRPAGPPPKLRDFDPTLTPLEHWEQRVRPQVEALVGAITSFPIDEVSLPELVQHVLAMEGELERLGTLHHQAVMPGGAAQGRFIEFCARHGVPQSEAAGMIPGVENLSLESSQEQWELGNRIACNPRLAALLEAHRPSELETVLRDLDEAANLLAGVDAHARRFGWRPASQHPYGLPVIEDRTPIWESARAAALGVMASPRERHSGVADRSLTLMSRVRASLPEEDRAEFDRLYAAARGAARVSEDHNVLIDQIVYALQQRAGSRVAGRLFAAELTAGPHDGYFLELAELASLNLERPDPALQAQLADRRRQWETWCTYTPPVALGRRPAQVDHFTDQFIGMMHPSSGSARVLSGTAGAAGIATGAARVLRDMSESDRLQAGDILVCVTTLPPWTPLFARAGAVVTMGGGVLSHAAITAREFGIPAVLSVADAITLIRDGQRITVDGLNGVVRLED